MRTDLESVVGILSSGRRWRDSYSRSHEGSRFVLSSQTSPDLVYESRHQIRSRFYLDNLTAYGWAK